MLGTCRRTNRCTHSIKTFRKRFFYKKKKIVGYTYNSLMSIFRAAFFSVRNVILFFFGLRGCSVATVSRRSSERTD